MDIAPLISLGEIKDIIKELWDDFKFMIFLKEYEVGVVLRAGIFKRHLKPGVNFRIPFVEEYHTAISTTDTFSTKSVNVTTTDDKTITAVPVVEFKVVDAVQYLLEVNDARTNIHDIVRATVSDYLTDCTWEECKLKRTLNAITRKVSEQCKPMGVQISRVMLTDMCVSRVIITQI